MASPASGILQTVTDHLRPVLTVLRRVRPIVVVGNNAMVTRADDVRAVLGDHEHFTVSHYAPKMAAASGPFILGLDDTELYRRDHAALRAAIRAEDVPALADATLAAARERVAAAGSRIDVVSQLADPVIDGVIAAYFGTPGPDTPTQLRWARDIFQDVFLNVGNGAVVHDRALAAASEMREHLDRLIAERRAQIEAGEDVADDVLTRLLRTPPEDGGLHDIAIRHNFLGLIAGWIPTVSKAFAMVVEELLRRPRELAGAQRAARDGDHELVAAYVFEALRFRPQTWALLRICGTEQVIAPGTRRATRIRAGARVLVATQSAMFDPRAVEAPGQFRVDRPWSTYLHFGDGLHTCFGLQINRVHLPALATALLEGAPIARLPGASGRLRTEGPYPTALGVALRP
ncbi:cytochrome P450 [Conexibacter woesei]|uniref:cytochrome P450 n=1 Tax=Conexibacter woesei TaxID=191495 RepID=UPI000687FD09|nr:cytochrome P450 [Conexibacter woesei]